MLHRLLEDLKKATSTSSALVDIAYQLRSSRLYEFLREVGRAKEVSPSTPNYLEVQAMQTAWSAGYNQCLDDIMLFREKYLEADLDKSPPKMSFGGIELALFKNDLTKEEADAIRTDKPIPRIKPRNTNSNKTTGK